MVGTMPYSCYTATVQFYDPNNNCRKKNEWNVRFQHCIKQRTIIHVNRKYIQTRYNIINVTENTNNCTVVFDAVAGKICYYLST